MNKKTILLVDDDTLMLKLTRLTLVNKGFTVLEASDGKKALEILHQHGPNSINLIITDYYMPMMSGLELANLVRDHKHHGNVPLILISSDTNITHSADSKYLVFDEIVHKPFAPEVILNKVINLTK